MVAIVAGASLRRAEPQPVGRPVAGSLETIAIHKGFQRMHWMPILGLPVVANASGQSRKQVAGQMRYRHPGQHQKARVVRQETEVCFPSGSSPTDPGIARRALPRRRAEQRTAHRPSRAVAHQIPDVLADFCHGS
ncbi:hypothetical protein DS62_09960 [Smithella sp. SC_K08D17]|nr:hypothetical protein KD27_08310 [Smithella sp. D17]KIE18517.1 hypothetical protein DS62_09960 [Smithella sp. SC_K08D17]